MKIERDIRRPLSELATVLTENQFWKLADQDPKLLEDGFVAVSPSLERGGRCAEDWTDGLPEGYVAVISDVLDNQYIAFLLNTIPCQVVLFDGKFNVKSKVSVNRKKVGALEVPLLDKEEQHIYAVAEALYSSADGLLKENEDDERYMHMFIVIENLCNSLAMDLFARQVFLEKGIYIYEHWKNVVERSDDARNLNEVFEALTGKDSPLRNDIMKMQIVLGS